MQGFPPEGYKPLPPNSPEDIYHEEVENHSDAGSAATPLLENPKRALVTVEEGIPLFLLTQLHKFLSSHSFSIWTHQVTL
jgi:hypothetical protein